MPAILHLASLTFKSDTSQNLSKALITSITGSWSFRKNVVSSAPAEHKNILSKILIPLIFLFYLMKIKVISGTIINK